MGAYLRLENGKIFDGRSCGAAGVTIGEVVFNTSMTGYQEILTEPANSGLILTMTYPLIGNSGINPEDDVSDRVHLNGFIMSEWTDSPSSFRNQGTLGNYLKEKGVVALTGVDTRSLAVSIRDNGPMRAGIVADCDEPEGFLDSIRKYNKPDFDYRQKSGLYTDSKDLNGLHIGVLDFGVSYNFIELLTSLYKNVTVLPGYDAVDPAGYDGFFMSGGCENILDTEGGNITADAGLLDNIREFIGTGLPIFGSGAGHLLIALAQGLCVERLKCGHRGGNYPVKNTISGKCAVTEQSHGFVVTNVPENIGAVSHININDNTIEGIKYAGGAVSSVQFYPDSDTIDEFLKGVVFNA